MPSPRTLLNGLLLAVLTACAGPPEPPLTAQPPTADSSPELSAFLQAWRRIEPQQTNNAQVIQWLGQPNATISFAHKRSYQYDVAGQHFCVYQDGSGLVWGTEANPCSTDEAHIPSH